MCVRLTHSTGSSSIRALVALEGLACARHSVALSASIFPPLCLPLFLEAVSAFPFPSEESSWAFRYPAIQMQSAATLLHSRPLALESEECRGPALARPLQLRLLLGSHNPCHFSCLAESASPSSCKVPLVFFLFFITQLPHEPPPSPRPHPSRHINQLVSWHYTAL